MRHLSLSLFLLTTGGCYCGFDRQYDFNNALPFAPYTNREVTLTRDAVLVRTNQPEDEHSLKYVLLLPHDLLTKQADQIRRHVVLPAGTKVFVMGTVLRFRRYPPHVLKPPGDLIELYSFVRLSDPWNKSNVPIVASFDHAIGLSWSSVYLPANLEMDSNNIRPAPWEPVNTPESRKIQIPPDTKYLVSKVGSGIP